MTIGYLYLTRNLVNGTTYIGQSSRLDPQQIRSYLGSGDLMRQAIDEFGDAGFAKEVLGYFDDQISLDYAEILKIAELRNAGVQLYNSGIGGPRAEATFREAMRFRFGVVPRMTQEWLNVVEDRSAEVKKLLDGIEEPTTDDFYQELESQLLVTQDLSRECPRCNVQVGAVCRTKTGNPSRNHAKR